MIADDARRRLHVLKEPATHGELMAVPDGLYQRLYLLQQLEEEGAG